VPAEQREWADVSGQGKMRWDDGKPGRQQFSPLAIPGAAITHELTADEGDMCTLGPAVVGGILTAGHCHPPGDPTQYLNSSADQVRVALGPLAQALDDEAGQDSAVLWTSLVDRAASARIAGTWPVAGVMSMEAFKRLPEGPATPVCFNGAKSGVQCGELLPSADDGRMLFAASSQRGDSGAPVFLVSAAAGHATLVGILEGGPPSRSDATYLDPALARMDATALADPVAAAAVAGDSRYSKRAVPLR